MGSSCSRRKPGRQETILRRCQHDGRPSDEIEISEPEDNLVQSVAVEDAIANKCRNDRFSETDPESIVGRSHEESIPVEDVVVAHSVAEIEKDDTVARRAIMAHLFELICTEAEDVIRDELNAHKHLELLNREMVISVGSNCTCPYNFELYPCYDSREDEASMDLQAITGMIRNGTCECEQGDERSSSRRLLDVAVALGELWLVGFLLEHGCEIDVYTRCCGKSPLHTAIGITNSDDTSMVTILLDSGRCNLNATDENNETTLVMAIRDRNAKLTKMLLDLKANPNVMDHCGDPVLIMATMTDDTSLVAALVEAGADVNAMNESEGKTALHLAVCKGNSAITNVLLSNGADANKLTRDGYPPIVLAVEASQPEILQTLLNTAARVGLPGPDGFTALHAAAWGGEHNCLEILLDHGADPDALTQCKNTPLSLAAHGGQLESLIRLLSEDVNVNNADKDLDTPLHYAAYTGSLESVRMLLKRGANPSVINDVKASPLWNAVYMKHLDVVRLLVLNNANLEIISHGNDQENNDGVNVLPLYPSEKSVLWVAVERRCVAILDLLVEAGYNLWGEEWLMQNNEDDIPEESLPMLYRLQSLVQQTPSLMLICRNFFRGQCSQSQLEHLVETSSLPNTLNDFLLLRDTVNCYFKAKTQ